MKRSLTLSLSIIAGAVSSGAQAQQDAFFRLITERQRVTPIAGTVIAVCPRNPETSVPYDYAGWDRKEVHIGGVTAVVPRTMTTVNSDLRKLDPFAGLARDVKVRQLLSLLNRS